ncbi:nucleoporin p58/p45-like [Mustela lutreola]|uniref:nucleoporin p58/p45-like n=1 Tax=Mustela lutreola TaxID=9666 RepID=UPI00279708F4|nr:nucleoporin p58/p45-like [Mustela lutreola]
MSTGFSFGTGTLGSTTVAPGGTGAGGGFSFGTGHLGNTGSSRLYFVFFINKQPFSGSQFGTLGSTATPATTSPSGGFGTGLFGSKPTTGFTLGGTNTGIAATITTGLTLAQKCHGSL